jgi:hypothetical protein
MRAAPLLLVCAASVALSGCVAAVIPVIAAGAMGKSQRDRARQKRAQAIPKPSVARPEIAPPKVVATVDPGGPVPPTSAPAVPEAPDLTAPSAPMLADSAFAQFALDQAARRRAGQSVASAVLVKTVDLIRPQFLPCDGLPLAVMIDVDGDPDVMRPVLTSLSSDLKLLRAADIGVVWITGVPERARGTARDGLTLDAIADVADTEAFLRDRGDRKQLLRLDIAAGRCIVAMLGDRKSDFDELFDYLRSDDHAVTLNKKWEQGWFLITVAGPPAQPDQPGTRSDRGW